MARYHVNPKTGRPNLCNAKTPERCDYYNGETNTEAPHFATKTEARAYVEKVMEKEFGTAKSISKNKTTQVKSEKDPYEKLKNLSFEKQVKLIKDNELSFDQLKALAEHSPELTDEIIFNRVINKRRIPSDVADIAIKTGSNMTKEILAQEDSLKRSQVIELGKSENRNIRASIAASHNLFKDDITMKNLIYDSDKYVAKTAWETFEKEMSQSDYIYKIVYTSSNPDIRVIAAQSQHLPIYAQAALSNDSSKAVKLALTSNPFKDYKIEENLAADRDPDVRASVAKKSTSADILDRLAFDINEKTMNNALNNKYISDKTLHNVKNEPSVPKKYRDLASEKLLLGEHQ